MTTVDPLVVDSLPAYDVGIELGRGGCGIVLSGRHRLLGRDVAIKQLPRAFASDPAVRSRFTTEARLLASLDHPHVVPVYDFVERDGMCLLVLEMLPGGTVWSRFTSSGFTAQAAVSVALASASGLKAAHEHGILHRDVKPENLMFAANGSLKVTDFGIAKVVGGDDTLSTRTGEILGTPAYIAPEQARGQAVSPATDIYALATLLYELLAGALPFSDDGDALALLFKHAYETPTPIQESAPQVPQPIAAVVMRGLATDPSARFDSAENFGVALAEAATGVWGAGWLSRETVPVMGADRIVSATQRGDTRTAPSTVTGAAVPPPPGVSAADFPPPPRHAVPAPPGAVVRPTITVHARGAVLVDLAESDLVPVQEVVALPGPAVPYLVAVGLGILVVLVALVGVGSPPRGGTVRPGTVTVAGIDPTSGTDVPIDLTAPVPVTGRGVPAGDQVTLTLQAAGRQLSQATATFRPSGAQVAAGLPALGGQYLVSGALTGTLDVSRGGSVVETEQFAVKTTQNAWISAVAAVMLVLLLFGVAYLESNLRSVRRGRRRVGPTIGCAMSGGVLGVVATGAVWILAAREPTVTTSAATAAVGALAGIVATLGSARIARRRRYLRGEQAKLVWKQLTGQGRA